MTNLSDDGDAANDDKVDGNFTGAVWLIDEADVELVSDADGLALAIRIHSGGYSVPESSCKESKRSSVRPEQCFLRTWNISYTRQAHIAC